NPEQQSGQPGHPAQGPQRSREEKSMTFNGKLPLLAGVGAMALGLSAGLAAATPRTNMLHQWATGSDAAAIAKLRQAVGQLNREAREKLQAAFAERHALQCGFCTPGMVMTAVDLVKSHPAGLSEKDIREGLEGNLCRCTGYHNIVRSIQFCQSGAKPVAV
ncbi:MAG: 2Fe-2S iron-sulfur cluster-binding protein, partial [Gammaproteobacteria bacterium]